MLNLQHLMRAPLRHFEVTMQRRPTLNAEQNARKCIAYVLATNADEARRLAERMPDKQAFKSVSAREIR